MATRRIAPEGLTPDTAAPSLALSPNARQRAEQAFHAPALVDEDEPDDTPQTPADRIATMLEEFGGAERATVKLYMADPRTNAETWCRDYSPQEFEAAGFEGIRAEWGPGKYHIRLYAISPDSGRYVVRARDTVTIAAPRNANPVAAVQQNSELSQVLAMMAEQNQRILEALQKPAAPPVDPMQQFMQFATLAGTMRDLFGGGAQKSSVGELVKEITALKGLAKELGGDGEREDKDPLLSLLPDVLGMVKQGMSNQQPPQVLEHHHPNPLHFPPVTLPPAIQQAEIAQQNVQQNSQPQTEEEMNLALMIKLKMQLGKLVLMAAGQKPVSEGVTFLVENLPDEFVEALYQDEWFEALSSVAPEVTPHREWFTQVRDAAEAHFFEEVPEDATPGGEPQATGPVGGETDFAG